MCASLPTLPVFYFHGDKMFNPYYLLFTYLCVLSVNAKYIVRANFLTHPRVHLSQTFRNDKTGVRTAFELQYIISPASVVHTQAPILLFVVLGYSIANWRMKRCRRGVDVQRYVAIRLDPDNTFNNKYTSIYDYYHPLATLTYMCGLMFKFFFFFFFTFPHNIYVHLYVRQWNTRQRCEKYCPRITIPLSCYYLLLLLLLLRMLFAEKIAIHTYRWWANSIVGGIILYATQQY